MPNCLVSFDYFRGSAESEDERWDKMGMRKHRDDFPNSDENDDGIYVTRSGRSTNSSAKIKHFL